MIRPRLSSWVSRGAMPCAAAALLACTAAACGSFAAADPVAVAPDGGAEGGGADGAVPPLICPAVPGCRVVFVTSLPVDANLGGIAGADAECKRVAAASSHPSVRERSFVAWLSTATSPVATRLDKGTTPYTRVDGVMIANDWSDLIDSTLLAPINVDESGKAIGAEKVWTGTTSNGQASSNTCLDWSTEMSLAGVAGQVGRTDRVDEAWTDADVMFPPTPPCGEVARLYCIEK